MRKQASPRLAHAGAVLVIGAAACQAPRLEPAAADGGLVSAPSPEGGSSACTSAIDGSASCLDSAAIGHYAVRSFLFDRIDFPFLNPSDFITVTAKQLLFAEVRESPVTHTLTMTARICAWTHTLAFSDLATQGRGIAADDLPAMEFELTVQGGKWQGQRIKPTLFGYRESYPGCTEPGTRVDIPKSWTWSPGSSTCACVDPADPPADGQLDDCRLLDVDHDNVAGFTISVLDTGGVALRDDGDLVDGELDPVRGLKLANRENHGTWSYLECDDIVGCPEHGKDCGTSANHATFVRMDGLPAGQECDQIVDHEADLFDKEGEPRFPHCE